MPTKTRKARFAPHVKQSSKMMNNKFTPAANESLELILQYLKNESGKKVSRSKLFHDLIKNAAQNLVQRGDIVHDPYTKESIMKGINRKLAKINLINRKHKYPNVEYLVKIDNALSKVISCL